MKKAVFLDVDGTILDSMNGKSEMTPTVEKAIHKLQETGNYVFIATGRPYAFISRYLHNFGFDGFLLSNGAQVIMKDETIYSDPMDKAFVRQLVAALDERNIQYILQGAHTSYIKSSCKDLYEFFTKIGIERHRLEREYDLEAIDVYKVEAFCDGKETEEALIAFMSAYEEYEYFFSVSRVLFEIHAKKNTKATGIMKTLELLEIPVEDSFAFGDGCNDIEMLKAAGCGIVMANASDEVKRYADQITDSVGEDGVATGIEKYILNEK